MNKEKVREYKLREIDRLRDEINTIATLEQDRVYKWERRSWGTGEPDPIIEYGYGILETFNQESMCFRVLASNVENNRYEDPPAVMPSKAPSQRKNYRFNITKVPYHRTLIPVKKSEIPVMVTSKWVSKELMEIMKGTSRKKCIL